MNTPALIGLGAAAIVAYIIYAAGVLYLVMRDRPEKSKAAEQPPEPAATEPPPEPAATEQAPERTLRMREMGFSWGKLPDGTWIEKCDTCGGNCGQCGTSLGMDPRNQPSMDRLVQAVTNPRPGSTNS